MVNCLRAVSGLIVLVLLSSCTDDNEHFCAKYSYLYEQLDEPGLPSYGEMKEKLVDEITRKNSDHSKMMLFVLEDHHLGLKQGHETAQEYCLRMQRWQFYR
jgi:hypothetical protein